MLISFRRRQPSSKRYNYVGLINCYLLWDKNSKFNGPGNQWCYVVIQYRVMMFQVDMKVVDYAELNTICNRRIYTSSEDWNVDVSSLHRDLIAGWNGRLFKTQCTAVFRSTRWLPNTTPSPTTSTAPTTALWVFHILLLLIVRPIFRVWH